MLDWNTPAIDFYRSLGAQSMSEWTIMRVSGSELAKLGAQTHPYGSADEGALPRT